MADPAKPPVVTADVRTLPKSDPAHDARYSTQLTAIRRLLEPKSCAQDIPHD